MTYREYITAKLRRFNATDEDVDLVLVDQSNLIPNGNDPVEPHIAKMALYNQMSSILPVANISEGGFSLAWNNEAIRLWYKSLARELGMPDVMEPAIVDCSNLW